MSAPEISVVMATQNAAEYVERSLRTLESEAVAGGDEIIVADCSTDGTGDIIREGFPHVRLLEFAPPTDGPHLLREALCAAQGGIVAITEPYCIFPPGWLDKVRRAHESDFAVIGGAVENDLKARLVDWACYFADYGAFMLPAKRRETPALPGNHVSYKRAVLASALDAMPDGFHKTFFHWDLSRRGARFLFDPELVVHWARRNRFGGFARRYLRNGREFASRRCQRITRLERVARAVTAPALPLLLLFERLRAVLAKRRHLVRVLATLPLVAAFVVAWSAGEFLGYLRGPDAARSEGRA